MSDAFSKITSILICVFMMFIIPVFYMKEEAERLKQTYILEELTSFVDGVRNTGIIGREDYGRLEQELFALGDSYDVELMHSRHMFDETGVEVRYFGEQYYTAQILENFQKGEDYYLSKNDYLRVVIYNSNDEVVAWYGGSVRYEAY